MSELTGKQKMFCEEWVIDFNGKRAALAAGYNKNSASEIASENLTKLNIQLYLHELMEKRAKRVNLTQDMVVKELMAIAFCDVSEFYCDITGHMLQPHELSERAAKATSSFKSSVVKVEDKVGSRNIRIESIDEYKRLDKIKALELLGKHLGVFEKDNDQRKPVNSIKVGFNDFYDNDDEEL